jgi:peptidoglycan hydrolase-like protein with peptidoglycan-binding domain
MATLETIIQENQTLTIEQLRADRGLVRQIQQKLRNLGLYPGGQWIDGLLGSENSLTRRGLREFCQAVNLPNLPSNQVAMNKDIAEKLIETKQLPFILEQAKNTAFIFQKLSDIQDKTPITANIGVNEAFIARTIANSPFEQEINNYANYLAQQPNGTTIISYGEKFQLSGSDKIVTFSPYPARGTLPTIDTQGLSFLDNDISHACICVGSFVEGDDEIKAHWLGRNALEQVQFLSATKFIGVLNTVSKVNQAFPNSDIDNCDIGISANGQRFNFPALIVDMVSYGKGGGRSNQLGAMFKRFETRRNLEIWTRNLTGNNSLRFRGYYGADFPPFIASPIVFDKTLGSNQVVLRAAPEVGSGDNAVSAYDLVRLISMLGWHLHLTSASRLPGAQWIGLESVVRAMGTDPARYIDVAIETLGLVNVISQPVVISKVGFGESSFTYVALVKFVDNRPKDRGQPAKFRTLAIALRTPTGSNNNRDNNLAATITEIIRRIFTEELA